VAALAGLADGLDSKVDRFMHKPKPHAHHKKSPEQMEKEVEDMARRVRSLAHGKVGKQLSKEVDTVRASLCSQQGFKRHERVPCENFMRQACHSFLLREAKGGEGTRSGKSVPAHYCQQFFQVKQPPTLGEVVEDVGKAYDHAVDSADDALNEVNSALTGDSKSDPEAEKVKQKPERSTSDSDCVDATWKSKSGRDCSDYEMGDWCTSRGTPGDGWLEDWGDFKDYGSDGMTAADACCACGGGIRVADGTPGAPAPAPAAAPFSPAGAPAAPPGIQAPTQPFHELGKEMRPLQDQGVSGPLVPEHADGETMVTDWQKEFGPGAGLRDLKAICSKYQDNEWCRLNGYYDKEKPKRSSSAPLDARLSSMLLVVMLAFTQTVRWS